jgi:hypothetical protein
MEQIVLLYLVLVSSLYVSPMSFDEIRKNLIEHSIPAHRWRKSQTEALDVLQIDRHEAVNRVRSKLQQKSLEDVFVVDGQCIAAYVDGNKVGVYLEKDNLFAESDLLATVTYLLLSVDRHTHIHLFAVDKFHVIHHFYVVNGQLHRSVTIQVDSGVREIVPISFHPAHELPHYFWSISNTSVTMHSIKVNKEVFSLVKYNIPSIARHYVGAEVSVVCW